MNSRLPSEEIAIQIRKWLQGKGHDFACARAYFGGQHDPDCEACLLIAAAKELERRNV